MTSLGQRAARATAWNAGATVARDALQFAAMLLLVRLLAPQDYGRFGLASAVIALMFTFSARSLADFALQERLDDQVHWRDYFSFGALLELSLFAATNVVALAMRYDERFAGAAPPVHVLSLLFLTNWPKEICVKMLQRDLDWKRFRVLWLAGAAVTSVLSVCLALLGAGAYALALPAVILPLVFWRELFVVRGWRWQWGWQRQHIVPALRFAMLRMFSGLLGSGRALVESGAITAMLGFAAFGIFGRAVGLAQMACGRFIDLFVDAVYPALTRLEPGSERFRLAATNVLRVAFWLAVPAAILVAELAELLVSVLYGSQWLAAIPLLLWAAAMVAAASLNRAAYLVLLASNRQRFCLLLDAALVAATVALAVTVLASGAETYLRAMAASYTAVAVASILAGVRWRAFDPRGVLAALAAALAAGAGAYLLGRGACEVLFASQRGMAAGVVFLAVFAAGYALILRVIAPRPLLGVLQYLPAGQRLARWLGMRRETA